MTLPVPTSTELSFVKPATLDLAEHIGRRMVKAKLEGDARRLHTLHNIYLNMLPLQARRCEAVFAAEAYKAGYGSEMLVR